MKDKKVSEANIDVKEVPEVDTQVPAVKNTKSKTKEIPKTGNPENTVMIGDTLVEIKSTKMCYQRNGVAGFYKMLEIYPLIEILNIQEGTLGDNRDGDTALLEWIIAVIDNEELAKKHYNDLDTETIEKMISIFRRVNKIDEKEEKLKNLEARMKGV